MFSPITTLSRLQDAFRAKHDLGACVCVLGELIQYAMVEIHKHCLILKILLKIVCFCWLSKCVSTWARQDSHVHYLCDSSTSPSSSLVTNSSHGMAILARRQYLTPAQFI
jgi:hypothetical protein